MVLADDIPVTSGNGSSTVIKNIHNMPWLKKSLVRKDSDNSKKTGGAMFKPLVKLKDDEQPAAEKKNKKRNKKPKKNVNITKNVTITHKSNDATRRINDRMIEERTTKNSQLPVAGGGLGIGKNAWTDEKNIAESLFPNAGEAAGNVQLSEEEQLKIAVDASIETAFLEKCVIDPPEVAEEIAEESEDDNIWKGVHSNLSSSSSEETLKNFDPNNNSEKSEDEVASSTDSTIAEKESRSEAGNIPFVPLNVPVVPSLMPRLDRFGRVDGYTEKHICMGKGARMQEEEYKKKLQQQQLSGVVNEPNQRQRYSVAPQDSRRPRNFYATQFHSYNNRSERRFGNNSNDYRGAVDKSNERQRHSIPSQDSCRPRNAYATEDNSRNDRPERRSSMNVHPGYNKPYGPPKNSLSFKRHPTDHSFENSDKRDFQKPEEVKNNRSSNDTNRDIREKEIPPLLSAKVSSPSNVATTVKGCARQIDLPITETPKEAPIKIDAEIHQQETKELPKDFEKPKYNLSDFKKRSNTLQEQFALPIHPNASAYSCLNAPTTDYDKIADNSCQINEMQVNRSQFTGPPPGFNFSKNSQNSCSNLAYVLPMDSSLTSSAYIGPVETSRTSSAYIDPAETSRTSSAYIDPVETSRRSSAYIDPVETSRTSSAYIDPAETSRTSSAYALREESPLGVCSDIATMEGVYARIKMYDPVLYNLLLQRPELFLSRQIPDTRGAAYSTIPDNHSEIPVNQESYQDSGTRGSAYSTIPDNRSEIPVDQGSYKDSGTLGSYDFPASSQGNQVQPLNPNAKQYSPLSEQAWISQNQQDPIFCYSVAPNSEPQSLPVYYQCVPPPQQDMFRQDNSAWTSASSDPIYNQVETSQSRTDESTPTAILGRQNNVVSEQNYTFQNVQTPMHVQPLNDDYPRCQSSGFGNIPTNTQRQVPYQASLPQCGVAPNHFCSIPCAATFGSQARATMNKCINCAQPTKPVQQYAGFVAMSRNSANRGNFDARQKNDDQLRVRSQQGFNNYETNSIITHSEHRFVEPVIRLTSYDERQSQNQPNRSRGRGRMLNNK